MNRYIQKFAVLAFLIVMGCQKGMDDFDLTDWENGSNAELFSFYELTIDSAGSVDTLIFRYKLNDSKFVETFSPDRMNVFRDEQPIKRKCIIKMGQGFKDYDSIKSDSSYMYEIQFEQRNSGKKTKRIGPFAYPSK
jgi:hypothetical protein